MHKGQETLESKFMKHHTYPVNKKNKITLCFLKMYVKLKIFGTNPKHKS